MQGYHFVVIVRQNIINMLKISWTLLIFIVMVGCENLTSDNEDYNGMETFLKSLESYSNLDSLNPTSVVSTNCEGFTQCRVNPNGTALWDVRATLYSDHMMQAHVNDEAKQKITIDGCLKYSTTVADYNTCMISVRLSMFISLMTNFNPRFRSLIEADECSLASTNCIVE
ncbi:unnamed protein product [Ceutorhynchus assimilis]|uniref:Uncharacterized protein n=1 Tax=Ceutorhynchus assimilis TaxID=467358 RepID=A0A9N9MS72_9CUCU|nr:unnamed protein product [Ceutorhynchus assimilis]